ncbi:ABC-F family ATP-binding cassette domain-containing protein [Candidatus Dependentiae bacterium]|nr:ABC-F family ATP-binding cassette domain-containing protein [Candidatus Dependentiae bacterium]
MSIIQCTKLNATIDNKNIFKDSDLIIEKGQKIGLIGRNGCGKSTLLKILVGIFHINSGNIYIQKDSSISYLPQFPEFNPEHTILQEIENIPNYSKENSNAAFSEIIKTIYNYEKIINSENPDLKLQSELHSKLDFLNGWDYYYRIQSILQKLDIANINSKIKYLSGGQKKKIAIAKCFIEHPDILLFDEPTNHLDISTIKIIEDMIQKYNGTMLLITHDRYFLDNTVDYIYEIENGLIKKFSGNYSAYLELKAHELEISKKAEESRLNILRNETQWIKRGAKARTTKQKARIDRYYELLDSGNLEKNILKTEFDFNWFPRLGNKILEIDSISKQFNHKTLFLNFSLVVKDNQKIAVIGPNGCGKSTLLKIIMNKESIDSGKIEAGINTKFQMYEQLKDSLDTELTLVQYIGDGYDYVTLNNHQIRVHSILKKMLFNSEQMNNKIKYLSGGELNRLVLLKSMTSGANFLLFDEPTNDLDIETLQNLEDSLKSFCGCIIFVSHDRFFIDKLADSILLFTKNNTILSLAGNYSDNCDIIESLALTPNKNPSKKNVAAESKPTEKQKKSVLSYSEKAEFASIEHDILKNEKLKSDIENEMSQPAFHKQPVDIIKERQLFYQNVSEKINSLYERWAFLEQKKMGS